MEIRNGTDKISENKVEVPECQRVIRWKPESLNDHMEESLLLSPVRWVRRHCNMETWLLESPRGGEPPAFSM